MSKQRTVHLECGKSTQVLYVLGTVINIDIYKPSPPGCRSFEVTSSPGVNYSISDKQNGSIVTHPVIRWALTEDSLLLVTVDQESSAANDGKVKVTFYGDDLDKPVDKMTLELTAVYVSLDVDADRDGIVEENNPNKSDSPFCGIVMLNVFSLSQDEIEFGYIEAPHKFMKVVMDSPRNRGLKNFAYTFLLGQDFGRIDVKSDKFVDSLDAFGNLEVSPPVTVNGKEYPLGRIVIGSHLPIHPHGRKMVKDTQDLLMAQSVQSPIILYSDWLYVGHVDEFMSFVPAPDRKGFRLLLASPFSFYSLFKRLQKEGHGEAMMFDNTFCDPVKINDILKNQTLHERNAHVQHCIDWNRDILKVELGLDEADIIDIPTLFKPTKATYVGAYFPDMVNMIVLGKYLGIPKPFGPLINGECALEAVVRSALEPLGLDCTFINDFTSYHKKHGEVHCGSNVRRKPFTLKWWNMKI
ncbi:protein-arginine deiminase type-2-like [Amblyraja radiata]|uniref:protein-arginine deiminase type-2-like n=1 Tax=Amblyraja radiata TaxID=386614 RepID=UPI001402BEBE|nr:protein-arginine deiminase type-2-like [Amblyraja radiata]